MTPAIAVTRSDRPAERDLLAAPEVAWPTVATSVATLGLWLAAVALAVSGAIPLWLGAVVATLAAFWAFTPLHDAVHRSVARGRLLDAVVGRIGSFLLAAPFPPFRFVHLEHHKHTNEPGADPDYWSGLGPAWLLPLRWVTQDLHYYWFYFRRLERQPRADRIEVAVSLSAQLGLVLASLASGHFLLVLLLWLLPSRLALVLLAFSFDYLPHRPHQVLQRDDPYRATLIHHLYPGIPFYQDMVETSGSPWTGRLAVGGHQRF